MIYCDSMTVTLSLYDDCTLMFMDRLVGIYVT